MGLAEFLASIRSRRILERYRLQDLILFGSFARGETARDIDILVEDDADMESLLELKQELEDLSGLPLRISGGTRLKIYETALVHELFAAFGVHEHASTEVAALIAQVNAELSRLYN